MQKASRLAGRDQCRKHRPEPAGASVASKIRRKGFRPLYLLLLIPYAAMMWVPSYNRIEPELAGIPFFYWYQMLWIVLGAAVMLPLYFREERSK
jgi:hypothetical protein